MKKVYLVTLGILLVASLILVGHAKPAPAWKWPKSLTICTQMAGSPMYALSVAAGSVLEKQTRTKVRVTPEEIGSLRLRQVMKGRYDMCTEDRTGIRMALEGIREHATRDGGPFPLRILWSNFVMNTTVMVRGDSHIKTMHDLKPGVKIAVHPGAAPRIGALALMSWAGLKEEDINFLETGSFGASMRAVIDGKADCCGLDPASPPAFEAEGNPHGIRWLDMDSEKDPEGMARYSQVDPTKFFGMPPPRMVCKSARGIHVARGAQMFVVTESTDPKLIYHLAKWLDENFDAYKGMHPASAYMSIDAFRELLDNTFLPTHEGTIKYLKEKGMWTAKDDKRQAYNVGLVNRYVEAYKAAIAKADAKGIKVNPENKDWMNLWAKHKKDLPAFRIMTETP